MSSWHALKVFFLSLLLVQVTHCVRSSTKTPNKPATLVRGQDDPHVAYSNPNEVRKKIKDEAFYQHLDAHNLNHYYLKREGASPERMVEAAKERKALSRAAKVSDQKVVKLKRLAKQLGSEQHPNFEDRHLQRLRPNPGNKIQKKPVSGANAQKP